MTLNWPPVCPRGGGLSFYPSIYIHQIQNALKLKLGLFTFICIFYTLIYQNRLNFTSGKSGKSAKTFLWNIFSKYCSNRGSIAIYYIYIFLYIYKNNNTIYNKPLLDKDLRSVPKFSKVSLFLHLKMSKLSFYNFDNNKIFKCCFFP